MAQIATEDTFVMDNDGIRRLIAKGSPIPQYLGIQHEGEEVVTKTLATVVVDEDASKPMEGAQRNPSDGLANTAAEVAAAARKSNRRGGNSKPAAEGSG